MSDQRYNGWTNYETWLVALWLDNEQCYHEDALEIASRALSPYQAGQDIRDYVEESMLPDNLGYGLAADFIQSAVQAVDWSEIGQHFMDAANEDEPT